MITRKHVKKIVESTVYEYCCDRFQVAVEGKSSKLPNKPYIERVFYLIPFTDTFGILSHSGQGRLNHCPFCGAKLDIEDITLDTYECDEAT